MEIEKLIAAFRKLLAFLAPSFGMTALVFLRKDIGSRALGLRHLVFGGLTLFWMAFQVERSDQRDASTQREWAEQTIRACHDDVTAQVAGGWRCSDYLPSAHARLAELPDRWPFMQVFFLAFLVVCIAQMTAARLRERSVDDSVYSFSDGVPLLSALTFWRVPLLSKIILEPALVVFVAWRFELLHHSGTARYFQIVAVYLCASAYQRWSAEFNLANEFHDFRKRMGIGGGSMLRPPTRPHHDGLIARLLHTNERQHLEALKRLRAFSLRNRARMLHGTQEPRPLLPGRDPNPVPAFELHRDPAPSGIAATEAEGTGQRRALR